MISKTLIIFLSFLISSYTAAIDTCTSGWLINSTQKTIDCHSVCQKAQSTAEIFAPTKSSTEWTNFRSAVSSRLNYVTLSDCCVANQGDACGGTTCKNAGTVACDGSCTGVTNMADETSCGTCSKCSAGTCIMYGSDTFLYPKEGGVTVHGNAANANCYCKNRGFEQACGYDFVSGTDNQCVHYNATSCIPDAPVSHSGDIIYSIVCEGFAPNCDSVTENFGGTCTNLDDTNGRGFKLTATALQYNGHTFDDDNQIAGNINSKNYCLLALYGNMSSSYLFVPNGNSYTVKNSGGTSQTHFFGRCGAGECATCTNDHILTAGEDFNNFSKGDSCAGNTDTDQPATELWCYWDADADSSYLF